MDYLKIRLRQRQGFAVILAVFLMLAFSVLGYTALNILVNKTDINVKTLASMQAFYLAQAAKNFYLEYYGSWGNDFTNTGLTQFPNVSNANISGQFAPGIFSVTFNSRNQRSCQISFTGISRGAGVPATISRTITQDFDSSITDVHPFRGAFLSRGGSVYLSPNNTFYSDAININITGNAYFNSGTRLGWGICAAGPRDPGACNAVVCNSVYLSCCSGYSDPACYSGCVTTRRGPTITGDVFVNNNAIVYTTTINGSITASGTITTYQCGSNVCPNKGSIICPCNPPECNPGTNPVIIPQKPAVVQTYYNNEINIANSITASDPARGRWLGDQNFGTMVLTGMNLYVKGNLTISGEISGGPANIVATGNIIVSNGDGDNTGEIGERISLIAGGTITTGTDAGVGIIAGGNWIPATSSIDGAGCLLYARALGIDSTDEVGGIEIHNNTSSNTRIKGRIIIPSSASGPDGWAWRYVNFNRRTRLWGVVYSKCINDQFGRPSEGGEVVGSVAIDGAIWAQGEVFTTTPYILRQANITYSQTEIPIAIKGLYHATGSQWRQQ